MDVALTRSDWSTPAPEGGARAFDHHAAALGLWLRRAGAEARLALVLASGPAGRSRLWETLTMEGVEVLPAPSTPERPLHGDLAAHSGNHFNRKLYVVDGLREPDQLRTLEGQRSVLRRTATWVALTVTSVAELEALYRYAPALMRDVQWRCLALTDEMAGASAEPDADLQGTWRRTRIAEAVYAHAMSPQAEPDYLDFARFVRSGYVGWSLEGEHPDRARLRALWSGDEPAPGGGPAVREAVARHRGGRSVELPDDPAGVAAHNALDAAAAAADADEIDACVHFLEEAARVRDPIAPELRFEILEKQAQVFSALDRHSPARAALDALEALAPELQSPLYAGRALLARARTLGGLDPARGRVDATRAASLFDAHGYPEWAEAARG